MEQMSETVKLSPLNLSGLLTQQRLAVDGVPAGLRCAAVEVVRYRCPECDETYDDEQEAEDCCQGKPLDADRPACPVCGENYSDHRTAADCCLWKDIDALTRWKVADAVERGASWAEALGVAGVHHGL